MYCTVSILVFPQNCTNDSNGINGMNCTMQHIVLFSRDEFLGLNFVMLPALLIIVMRYINREWCTDWAENCNMTSNWVHWRKPGLYVWCVIIVTLYFKGKQRSASLNIVHFRFRQNKCLLYHFIFEEINACCII